MTRVWIIGSIAEDFVLKLNSELTVGNFHVPQEFISRSGGSTANVAIGLASGPVKTCFITYLGEDATAEKLNNVLQSSGFDKLSITRGSNPTPRCLVIIDSAGERTLVLATPPLPDNGGLTLVGSEIAENEIFVLTRWDETWLRDYQYARKIGCKIVLGLAALNAKEELFADVVIGSIADIPNELEYTNYLDRFSMIVVTRGKDGATLYTKTGTFHADAEPVTPIDTTGAGDSFLAGFLTGYALGFEPGVDLLTMGTKWAGKMVMTDASIPPPFNEVEGLDRLISRNINQDSK